MKRIFILFLLIAQVSFAKDVQNNFLGSSFSGLRRSTTVFEYDGKIDNSGNLLDTAGTYNLAPTASPTTSYSTFQMPSGRRVQARTFNGTTQYYSVAHSDAFNFSDTDFSVTVVLSGSAAGSGTDGFFRHSDGVNGGINAYINGSGYVAVDFFPATIATATGPAVSIRDGYYHIVQIVRKNSIAYVYFDGSGGTPVSVAAKGTDVTTNLYVGTAGGTFFEGSIQYVRADTEALSAAQLARDRETIWGTYFGSGNLSNNSNFSRSTIASVRFSDGTVGYVGANVPRVAGDGGGVVIEGQKTNVVLQSQTLGTTWTQVALTSISSDGASAPDLTTTADGLVGTAVDTLHGVTQDVTLTATNYAVSVWAKPGNKDWIYMSDDTVANATMYCNVNRCSVGTVGAGATYTRAEQFANGWCRCSFSVLGTAAAHTIKLASANADTDNDFAGDAATVNTWLWGAQVEYSSSFNNSYYPSSYCATIGSTCTRSADLLRIYPWRISKNTVVSNPTLAMYFDNDVCNTSPCYTYASEVGNYSFTVYGDTKHAESQTLNDYFDFDGTGDYLKIAHASSTALYPTGDFSIVAIVSTASVAGGNRAIFSNYGGSSTGFELFQTGGNSISLFTGDGSGTQVTKVAAIYSDSSVLITATFQKGSGAANSTANVYVNDLAVETSAVMRYPTGAAAGFSIGGIPSPGEYWNGKIHYLAYYLGKVITQAEHNAMYASFKESSLTPVKIGNSYEHKKIYISFDARLNETNLLPAISLIMFEFSGSILPNSSTRNRIDFYADAATGRIYYLIYDDSSTQHSGYISGLSNFNKWRKHEVYFDCSNMANMYTKTDGAVTGYLGNSGTCNFDFTNAKVLLGASFGETSPSNVRIRNLQIRTFQ